MLAANVSRLFSLISCSEHFVNVQIKFSIPKNHILMFSGCYVLMYVALDAFRKTPLQVILVEKKYKKYCRHFTAIELKLKHF